MEDNYLKEKAMLEITEEYEKKDILRNIINTRAALGIANKNFEFANTNELIDYYIYQIKAMQSQLDSLIKLAKSKGIETKKIA